jgi:hypothetical protein
MSPSGGGFAFTVLPVLIGAPPTVGLPTVAATARGNIDYDQIRVAARTGNGTQVLTWQVPAPAVNGSLGTAGMVAYDALGNFYWCYSANQWARIGPAGWSNTF